MNMQNLPEGFISLLLDYIAHKEKNQKRAASTWYALVRSLRIDHARGAAEVLPARRA